MKYRILVNPTAGSGSAARRLPAIEGAFRQRGMDFDCVLTRAPGDAARLAREAQGADIACLVVVGGDGTLNEVAQAYLDEQGEPRRGPDLALISAGTGGDFRRSFGLDENTARSVERIHRSRGQPLDLGIISVTRGGGERIRRAFLNITSFGLGGLTDRIVSTGPKWLGGRAAFLLGALRALAVYRPARVEVLVDGQPFVRAPILNVAIANGRYFGGGMFIAPDADPSDGLFDVVALADMTRSEGLALTPGIYRGAHIGRRGVLVRRSARVEAAPLRKDDEVLVDMDGEMPGRLPLVAEIRKHALRLRV